jgi:hypothetical protein
MPDSPESKETPQPPAPIDAVEAQVPQKPDKTAADLIRWVPIAISVLAMVISGVSACNSKRSADTAQAALKIAEGQLTLATQNRQDSLDSAKRQQADVERSRRAAEQSATAASSSAESSREQLKATAEMFRFDQRAQIDPAEARVVERPTPTQRATFAVYFRNSGKTTAFSVKSTTYIILRPSAPDPLLQFPATDEKTRSVSDIGPGGSLTAYGSRRQLLTQEELDALKDGKLVINFYGVTEYLDGMRKLPVRREWCYEYPASLVRQASEELKACASYRKAP